MKRLFAALSLAVISAAAFAQASAPADKAKDSSEKPAATAPARQGMGMGMGMGPGGPGPHGPMMRFNEKNTPGWSLMTPEERNAHRDKMHSFQTVEECRSYHDEHLKQMEARAKEQGKAARPFRGDPCTMMQRQGVLKK